MNKWYILIACIAFVIAPLGAQKIIAQPDFSKGPGTWRLVNGAEIKKEKKIYYVHVQHADYKKSILCSLCMPSIPVNGTVKQFECSFKYRTDVVKSSPHSGAWVYYNVSADGKPVGEHKGHPLKMAAQWTEEKFIIDIPDGTKNFFLEFRLQGHEGKFVDYADIVIKTVE